MEKINEDVSITIKSLKTKLSVDKNVTVSASTIERAIKNFHYSFKRVQLVPARRNTENNIKERFIYANNYLALNEDRIVFADEMGMSCSIRSSYGRSLVGTTPRKLVRSIRSKNYSISAAMNKQGILLYEILSTSFNGERYSQFIRKLLMKLKDMNMDNMIIIMDNCSIHKVKSVRALISDENHTLMFLPPYSPQLNPIEESFSKWKNAVKSSNPNTVVELEEAIRTAHNSITADDCENYFGHMRQFTLQAIRREDF